MAALRNRLADVDHDGCDTPCEVYLAQRLPDGTWRSPYDGFVSATPQDFQVDHVVALAEAWDSGAAAWPADLRAAIYNDQIDQLLVVSSSSNGSKSDGDPADWRPPDPAAWCDFAQRWVAVKVRYQLSADPAEVGALHQLLGTCTAA